MQLPRGFRTRRNHRLCENAADITPLAQDVESFTIDHRRPGIPVDLSTACGASAPQETF